MSVRGYFATFTTIWLLAMLSTFRAMQDYGCLFRTQMTNLVNRVIQVVGMKAGYFATFTTIWLAMLSTFRIVMQDYFAFFRTQMTNLVNRVIQVVGMSVRDISRHSQQYGWQCSRHFPHCDAGLLCLFPYANDQLGQPGDTSCWHECGAIFRRHSQQYGWQCLDISHCDVDYFCLFPYANDQLGQPGDTSCWHVCARIFLRHSQQYGWQCPRHFAL